VSAMIRQEALNFSIAELLCGLGILARAEIRKMKAPDLLITYPLLGTLLGEAEVGTSWNDIKAKRKLENRVKERFSDMRFKYVDFVLMLVYPRSLVEKASQVSAAEVGKVIEHEAIGAGLVYRVSPEGLHTYIDPSQQQLKPIWYPDPIYCTQIPSMLESLSKEFFGEYIKPEEIVRNIINLIDVAANHARDMATESWWDLWEEVARDLEIDPEAFKSRSDVVHLAVKTLFTLSAITFMIYEIARSRCPDKLKTLPKTLNFQGFAEAVEHLGKVNYLELVELLSSVLGKVPSEDTLVNLLSELYAIVSKNVNVLVRSGWDTLAMIYQRLLSETYRKAYATFYTKLPAARLLAELSIERPEVEVIDPAAGTGSLLLSTFYTRQWLYLSPKTFEEAERAAPVRPVLDEISEHILTNTYGLDALHAAIALSAGSLTIASLAIPRKALRLFPVPVGVERAGSLDLLTAMKTAMPKDLVEIYGTFDLVIMNPPFTRSDRIPGLIGDRARRALQDANLTFGGTTLTSIFTAGLAKPFLALADKLLNKGGRIAAVLPNSVLSRSTWEDLRRGILGNYMVKYIVISWAPGTPNFSSDTEFREILMVVEKEVTDAPVKVINLLEPVEDLHLRDVITIANLAIKSRGTVFTKATGKEDNVIAQVAEIPQGILRKYPENMYRLVAFSNRELLEWHINLIDKCSVRLDSILKVGSVIDHTEGLKVISAMSEKPRHGYLIVWGSGCEGVSRPVVKRTDRYLIVEDEKRARVKFWKRPSRYFANLFVLRRGQLDTQCVLAFKTEKPVASNVWWPLKLKEKLDPTIIYAFLAFMNSTFGFIHLLAERLETRGLWAEFKKKHLHATPIPDFRAISNNLLSEQRSILDESVMPRFGDYLKEMAELEQLYGSWIETAKHVSEQRESPLASRAKLDLLVFEDLLKELDPNLKPPSRLYQLIYEETQTLREIMEKGNGSTTEVIKDTGLTKLKRRKYTPLDEWLV